MRLAQEVGPTTPRPPNPEPPEPQSLRALDPQNPRPPYPQIPTPQTPKPQTLNPKRLRPNSKTLHRRSAKDERVLFHYNGHGVPRPTTNSEIWVFNKNFTQYIPLSIYDLQTWLGSPSIYVFDCSSAGVLINNQQNQDDHIIFAACAAGEFLPQNPDLPAGLSTPKS